MLFWIIASLMSGGLAADAIWNGYHWFGAFFAACAPIFLLFAFLEDTSHD